MIYRLWDKDGNLVFYLHMSSFPTIRFKGNKATNLNKDIFKNMKTKNFFFKGDKN
jgi:hypothetical protein